jgi:hypothetical protein
VTILLSIDGGDEAKTSHRCYVSEFESGELVRTFACNRNEAIAMVRSHDVVADRVAVERPMYDGRMTRGVPPSIVINLAWNAARVAEALANGCPVEEVTVNVGADSDWIGQVSKPILHGRIWNALSAEERRRFPADTEALIYEAKLRKAKNPKSAPFKHHSYNTLDSAGVGLFVLGRIGKGGVKR